MVYPLSRTRTYWTGAFSSFREGLHQFKFFFAAFATVIVSRHGYTPECDYPLVIPTGNQPNLTAAHIAVNAPRRSVNDDVGTI